MFNVFRPLGKVLMAILHNSRVVAAKYSTALFQHAISPPKHCLDHFVSVTHCSRRTRS